jgi:hypothetical protein
LAVAVVVAVQTVIALAVAVPGMAAFAAIDRQEYQLEADW